MLKLSIKELINKYTYSKEQAEKYISKKSLDEHFVLYSRLDTNMIKYKFNNYSSISNNYYLDFLEVIKECMRKYEFFHKTFYFKKYNDSDQFLIVEDLLFNKSTSILNCNELYYNVAVLVMNEICLTEFGMGFLKYLASDIIENKQYLEKLYIDYLNAQDIYIVKTFYSSKFKNKVYPKKISTIGLYCNCQFLKVDSETLSQGNKIKKEKDLTLTDLKKYLMCFSKEDVKIMLEMIKENELKKLNRKLEKSENKIKYLEKELEKEKKAFENLTDKTIYFEEQLNDVLGL